MLCFISGPTAVKGPMKNDSMFGTLCLRAMLVNVRPSLYYLLQGQPFPVSSHGVGVGDGDPADIFSWSTMEVEQSCAGYHETVQSDSWQTLKQYLIALQEKHCWSSWLFEGRIVGGGHGCC